MFNKLLVILLTAFVASTSFSQDTIKLSKTRFDPKSDRYKVVTDRPPQTVFAELLGPGLLLSANYDRRFEKRTDGFGFRVGITPILPGEIRGFIGILGINHLVGNNKKGRFFETGLNFSYLSISDRNTFSSNRYDGSFISLNLGYRSQPVQGGFCFRGGINPIFIERIIIPYPYLSFGFNF